MGNRKPRGAQLAVIGTPEGPLHLVHWHLGLNERELPVHGDGQPHAGREFQSERDDLHNQHVVEPSQWRDHERLREALEVFGLASLADDQPAPIEVIQLAEQRRQARLRREYAESDALRAAIETQGWEVRDVEDGYQLVPK